MTFQVNDRGGGCCGPYSTRSLLVGTARVRIQNPESPSSTSDTGLLLDASNSNDAHPSILFSSSIVIATRYADALNDIQRTEPDKAGGKVLRPARPGAAGFQVICKDFYKGLGYIGYH